MKDNKITQTFYLAIDDSGQLSHKDKIMTFGGIILFDEEEKNTFIKEYQKIVNKYKCCYCYNRCSNKCPELKSSNLRRTHRLLFLNVISKYHLMSVIINNKDIYKNIMNNPKAKGRYLDYAIKMMIKNSLKILIKQNIINPHNNIKLIIYVDESSMQSNGYYNLQESIYEELKKGMKNLKNNSYFKNLFNNNLDIILEYGISKENYLIQAADIIAGTTRRDIIQKENNIIDKVNYKLYLP